MKYLILIFKLLIMVLLFYIIYRHINNSSLTPLDSLLTIIVYLTITIGIILQLVNYYKNKSKNSNI